MKQCANVLSDFFAKIIEVLDGFLIRLLHGCAAQGSRRLAHTSKANAFRKPSGLRHVRQLLALFTTVTHSCYIVETLTEVIEKVGCSANLSLTPKLVRSVTSRF